MLIPIYTDPAIPPSNVVSENWKLHLCRLQVAPHNEAVFWQRASTWYSTSTMQTMPGVKGGVSQLRLSIHVASPKSRGIQREMHIRYRFVIKALYKKLMEVFQSCW